MIEMASTASEVSRQVKDPHAGLLEAKASEPFTKALARRWMVVGQSRPRASAEQMFESGNISRSQQRLAELREQFEESVDPRDAMADEVRKAGELGRAGSDWLELHPPLATHQVHQPWPDRAIEAVGQQARSPSSEMTLTPRPQAAGSDADGAQTNGNSQTSSINRAPQVSMYTGQALPGRGNVSPPAVEVARLMAGSMQQRVQAGVKTAGSGHLTLSVPREAPGTNATPRAGTPAKVSRPPQTEPSKAAFERIIRAIRLQPGRSTARVLLDPPELGRIHVRVRVEGERVQIGVDAEREAARELILSRAIQLRSSLEQQGLTVERIEIVAGESGFFRESVLGPRVAAQHEHAQGSGTGKPSSRGPGRVRHRDAKSRPGLSNLDMEI